MGMGRIEEMIQSRDGHMRSAKICYQTAKLSVVLYNKLSVSNRMSVSKYGRNDTELRR